MYGRGSLVYTPNNCHFLPWLHNIFNFYFHLLLSSSIFYQFPFGIMIKFVRLNNKLKIIFLKMINSEYFFDFHHQCRGDEGFKALNYMLILTTIDVNSAERMERITRGGSQVRRKELIEICSYLGQYHAPPHNDNCQIKNCLAFKLLQTSMDSPVFTITKSQKSPLQFLYGF